MKLSYSIFVLITSLFSATVSATGSYGNVNLSSYSEAATGVAGVAVSGNIGDSSSFAVQQSGATASGWNYGRVGGHQSRTDINTDTVNISGGSVVTYTNGYGYGPHTTQGFAGGDYSAGGFAGIVLY